MVAWLLTSVPVLNRVHCDNCSFDFLKSAREKVKTCKREYLTDELCSTSKDCHKKSATHTLFLYLNNADGGNFVFYDGPGDYKFVQPKEGRLLLLTSGAENPHGVAPVLSGHRYSMGMWLHGTWAVDAPVEPPSGIYPGSWAAENEKRMLHAQYPSNQRKNEHVTEPPNSQKGSGDKRPVRSEL